MVRKEQMRFTFCAISELSSGTGLYTSLPKDVARILNPDADLDKTRGPLMRIHYLDCGIKAPSKLLRVMDENRAIGDARVVASSGISARSFVSVFPTRAVEYLRLETWKEEPKPGKQPRVHSDERLAWVLPSHEFRTSQQVKRGAIDPSNLPRNPHIVVMDGTTPLTREWISGMVAFFEELIRRDP